jgi:5'-nucleotidase/UDP-sugar diphosphatase
MGGMSRFFAEIPVSRLSPCATLAGLLLAVGVLAGCANAPVATPQPGVAYKITVLHTNDHHGRFWKNSDGEYGMAALKTAVDRVRAEVAAQGGQTLLLSGGDINTGVPESDAQDAVPDFKGMNLLGYSAMAVGNHEFDKPFATLMMQRQLAQFPMLSANIYRDGQRVFQPYQIFHVGPVRVVVLGLTTKRTVEMSNPESTKGLDFRDPIDEAAKLVPQLHQQADVVMAVTHMGHYEDGRHGWEAPGDVEMARAVNGLDAIVGGHSHTPVCMKGPNVREDPHIPGAPCQPDRQNGTWIVQAENWGKYLGRADFEYRDGKFTLQRYTLIPINLKDKTRDANGQRKLALYQPEIAEDPHMLALLAPYQQFGQQKLLVEIGSADSSFDDAHDLVSGKRPGLSQLICRAMMARTKADFAIMNSGGVRDSLPEGKLSYRDVLKVHPFGNTVVTVDLKGSEVLAYLAVLAKMTPDSGAYPQRAGLAFSVKDGQAGEVTVGGQPLEPGKTYRMAINSFTAAGGDGYPKLLGHPGLTQTGFTDAEVLRDYISSHSPVSAKQFPPAPRP